MATTVLRESLGVARTVITMYDECGTTYYPTLTDDYSSLRGEGEALLHAPYAYNTWREAHLYRVATFAINYNLVFLGYGVMNNTIVH